MENLSLRDQERSYCVYFNGRLSHDSCDAGIKYNDVMIDLPEGGQDMPCMREPRRKSDKPLPHCAKRRWPTQEELDAREVEINQWIAQMIERQNNDQCIHCGAKIERKEQIGRCIYAFPCGCRQGQGELQE